MGIAGEHWGRSAVLCLVVTGLAGLAGCDRHALDRHMAAGPYSGSIKDGAPAAGHAAPAKAPAVRSRIEPAPATPAPAVKAAGAQPGKAAAVPALPPSKNAPPAPGNAAATTAMAALPPTPAVQTPGPTAAPAALPPRAVSAPPAPPSAPPPATVTSDTPPAGAGASAAVTPPAALAAAPALPSTPAPAAQAAAPTPPAAASPSPAAVAPSTIVGPIARAIEEARTLFQAGDVQRARERLQSAGNGGGNARNPDLLLELGRTYDPNYLDRLAKKDATANPTLARALYEQAAQAGSSAAAFDLLQLRRTTPEAR